MELVTALILAALIAFLFYLKNRGSGVRLPPGPRGLPILGNMLSLRTRDYLTFTKWKKYGPICTVRLGSRRAVLLNSYDAIYEAFVGNADALSGRLQTENMKKISRDSGVIFKDGPVWQEHRRFLLRVLKDFGAGRQQGEQMVLEECLALREKLERMHGSPVEARQLYTASVNNIIARFTFGQRCGTDDPEFKKYAADLEKVSRVTIVDRIPGMIPWVLKIKPLYRLYRCFSDIPDTMESMHDFIIKKIEEHSQELRSMDHPPERVELASDVCEAQLIEQANQEAANPGKHTFQKWQIIRSLTELFFAGTETTSSTLNWATALLATHRDVQRRVRQEINSVIGQDRSPTMADRPSMPYVCAVMDEVLRFSSLVANNLPHRTTVGVDVCGYHLPANTMVLSNLYGVHRDPKLWAKPNDFFPGHFLAEDGSYRPSKHLIPFSMGKRSCLGESLARMEIFLLTVTLFQAFDVRLEDPNADTDAILSGRPTGFRRPLQHNVVFSKLD